MGTYVVGDIHGCFSKWIALKDKIEKQDSEAKFIFVGDIIDRGSEMSKMLVWALENITSDGKYRMVCGNHEDLKIIWWKYNRGAKDYTPEHYDFHEFVLKNDLGISEVDLIIDFFKSLPLYIEETVNVDGRAVKFVVMHGGLNHMLLTDNGEFDSAMLTDSSVDDYCKMCNGKGVRDLILWERNYWGYRWKSDTIIVHGHTPTALNELRVRSAVPGRIDFRPHDINVDTGAVYHKSLPLAAIRLEDLEEFYSNDVVVDYPKNIVDSLVIRKRDLFK